MSESSRRSPFSNLTESVNNLSRQARARQEAEQARQAGIDGRGQPGHAGKIGRDKKGTDKKTYYISRKRQRLVEELAEQEEVSQSNIVEAAIVAFYNACQAGLVDLQPFKKIHSASLKVTFKLELPDDFGTFLDPPQH